MSKHMMLLTLIPAAVLAQPAVITNYYDSTGVFRGSVDSTPYGGTVYGSSMQIEGYFTSSSPIPVQPSVPLPVQQPDFYAVPLFGVPEEIPGLPAVPDVIESSDYLLTPLN